MNALDTNILVRYLIADDAKQAAIAERYILTHCTKSEPGYINSVVLCELVWVLTSSYGYSKSHIIMTVESLLNLSEFKIEHAEIVWEALFVYKENNADFTDILISRLNQSAGYAKTVTFDKKAGKLPGFKLLA